VAGIRSAVRSPRAERGLGLPLPDTLSTNPHSPSFLPTFPLQNASFPPCDALLLLLSSLCEMVFPWAESQAGVAGGRGTVPWQDLGLCLEAPKHLLRASRRAGALGSVLATSPALSCSIRSGPTSVLGLWQLYLAVTLVPDSRVRNRRSRCALPSDQQERGSAVGPRSPRARASVGAVLKGKAFGQGGLTFSLGSLGTCNVVATR